MVISFRTQVTGSMASVVKGMDKAMQSMNLEQVSCRDINNGRHPPRSPALTLPLRSCPLQISMVMDKFETQFEDLDVQTSTMEGVMGSTVASSTPQDQVDLLMAKVADENGIELGQKMEGLANVPSAEQAQQETSGKGKEKEEGEDDKLAQRLRALRPAT